MKCSIPALDVLACVADFDGKALTGRRVLLPDLLVERHLEPLKPYFFCTQCGCYRSKLHSFLLLGHAADLILLLRASISLLLIGHGGVSTLLLFDDTPILLGLFLMLEELLGLAQLHAEVVLQLLVERGQLKEGPEAFHDGAILFPPLAVEKFMGFREGLGDLNDVFFKFRELLFSHLLGVDFFWRCSTRILPHVLCTVDIA